MTESPTQTLRRAAEKLRGIANAATEGPWATGKSGMSVWVESAAGDLFVADTGDRGNQFAEADAAHIAAMHPRVAVAVADWLDAEADCHEGATAVSEAACALAENAGAGQHRVMVAASTLDQALAVARAVLGEEADAA